jgi:hypothetical protein
VVETILASLPANSFPIIRTVITPGGEKMIEAADSLQAQRGNARHGRS